MIGSPTTRTAVGTYPERLWVLLSGEPERGTVVRSLWERRGHEIHVCEGPSPGHSCPVVDGGWCPVVENAELVVNALAPGSPTTERLLRELAMQHPDLPVIDVLP